MNITKDENIAAQEIVELIANKLGDNRKTHPGTAISAGARLAGSFMFRSFNLNLEKIKPGTPILSEMANEKGPTLINVLGQTMSNFGISLNNDAINKSPHAESNISFLDALNKLQDNAHEIMIKNNLSYEQMSYSCAIATAFIVKECQADLTPEKGFNTAVYGFIEGSKTCPPAFAGNKTEKKSFFKFWK